MVIWLIWRSWEQKYVTNTCSCIEHLQSAIFICTCQTVPQTMHCRWSGLRSEGMFVTSLLLVRPPIGSLTFYCCAVFLFFSVCLISNLWAHIAAPLPKVYQMLGPKRYKRPLSKFYTGQKSKMWCNCQHPLPLQCQRLELQQLNGNLKQLCKLTSFNCLTGRMYTCTYVGAAKTRVRDSQWSNLTWIWFSLRPAWFTH